MSGNEGQKNHDPGKQTGGDDGGTGGEGGDGDGDSGDPGDGGGSPKPSASEMALKRQLEREQKKREAAEARAAELEESKLSEAEKKHKDELAAEREAGRQEAAAEAKAVKLESRVLVAMAKHGIPDDLLASFTAALGDVEPEDVADTAAELVKQGGVWARFGEESTEPGRGGPSDKPRGDSFEDNPWSAASWNVTKQGQVLRKDRELAGKMAKAAGSSLTATGPPKQPA